jgi:hypothetical protein
LPGAGPLAICTCGIGSLVATGLSVATKFLKRHSLT